MNSRVAICLAVCAPFTTAAAQSVSYPPAAWQIASAVSPLPENLRAGAKVLGYNAEGKLVTLRQGSNSMTCLADNPSGKLFHVACYHRSLEPFMSRGRELHALKKSSASIDSVRGRDIQLGKYSIPQKSALYQYFA